MTTRKIKTTYQFMEIGQPLRQTQTGNVESICFVRFLQDQSKKYAMDSYGDTFNKHNE